MCFGKGGLTFPQPLVFPADKHGRQHVSRNEEQQEIIVQAVVPRRVKHTQQDQARGAGDGTRDGQAGQDLLGRRGVGRQAALVAQVAVGAERKVEEDGGQDTACDEQRLEVGRADVADVGDALVVGHGRVVDLVGCYDPVQEKAQEGGEPDEAG